MAIETVLFILIAGIAVVICVLFFIWLFSRFGALGLETPEKRAGRRGERFAAVIIQEVLKDDDVLLTNIPIVADGKQTELDNVVINANGVFIIEVKAWSGMLDGDEESSEWIQTKSSSGGAFYQKAVKNPIRQVKRQIYILSQYLKENGVSVWLEGYVFFVEGNSPIESSFILETRKDIDIAIHHESDQNLSGEVRDKITALLSG